MLIQVNKIKQEMSELNPYLRTTPKSGWTGLDSLTSSVNAGEVSMRQKREAELRGLLQLTPGIISSVALKE